MMVTRDSATPAIVIGAGIGGLASAIRLRVKGYPVGVYETQAGPGGKLTEVRTAGYRFDMGPSLFTLPEQVDELFELAGKNPRDYFSYTTLPVITRYFYPDGTRLDAWQDPEAFAQEVEARTGEPAAHVSALLHKSRELYEITRHVFLERSLHRLDTYTRLDTLRSMLQVHKLDAFRSMHRANIARFRDPRVVQLFDRYATYNGSDPYQAPATLSIIPHLEHNLGAYYPQGGMYSITRALHRLAEELGVVFHFDTPVSEIVVRDGTAVGIRVGDALIPAAHIVSNADIVPTYRRLLPGLPAPEAILSQPRSSSALIFYWGMDRQWPETEVHNIFFSADYQAEFAHIWQSQTLWHDPTVYLYVSARVEPGDAPAGCDNFFVMINTPCDQGQDWDRLIAEARTHILRKLEAMLGTPVAPHIRTEQILEPRTIATRTSSWQGALYGNSSNNAFAAFMRHPNTTSRIKGLYFAGGSVHPGGGIPLCLLSARIATDPIVALPGQ
ncbi:MAG: 1-hydroxycarotenoid 3,4-desaturase CrtD [Bacteroidia bacterium]|nr:1-hydroxycarotenoid 3,4-desaturase CrtD [Bacteroidia bacterium]